jgi:hypothetical protein
MKTDKVIDYIAFYDENERPESKEVIKNLEDIFKRMAKNDEIIATAIAYDAKIKNEFDEDAIIISMEHRTDYSIKIALPYKIKNKLFGSKIDYYELIAFEGSKNIF